MLWAVRNAARDLVAMWRPVGLAMTTLTGATGLMVSLVTQNWAALAVPGVALTGIGTTYCYLLLRNAAGWTRRWRALVEPRGRAVAIGLQTTAAPIHLERLEPWSCVVIGATGARWTVTSPWVNAQEVEKTLVLFPDQLSGDPPPAPGRYRAIWHERAKRGGWRPLIRYSFDYSPDDASS